ncbi:MULTISPECIES: hypothetical protein [unclassified Streptomyces]|uniref:hypothetical protein n=1 Tax=unclassified Streptomyces TaxID=2593676 RepID=UPI00225A2D3F|nr:MULTISPECIES: hypothetical protein [unclassified Streptomyces]MCX5057996.1 hypothetical protein [Streptomyces sp. NBC_00452]MCX5245127.1 hypothetical protein [Streptomyces sp. NBC_00201]MCX5289143.1 hypothetical protein [Streptomyces sp. NBC_00183]
MRLRLPEERPTEPPTGYKIAHPVLSQDGTRAGFTGVSLGGALPYGALADASCVYGLRHRAPHRRCDCGFHCVHDRAAAEALLCTAEHRAAVLLEVSVLGAYIRFERGFRYARQRVRTATVGPCTCGTVAAALADAGWGRPGWLALAPSCAGCVHGRPSLSLAAFARLAGEGLRMVADSGDARTPVGLGAAEGLGVPELIAEAALLQARLDWFQTQLGRLGGDAGGGRHR